jgi:endogenous inhibitor of DNA gyrase (YacG/DUF329 family)
MDASNIGRALRALQPTAAVKCVECGAEFMAIKSRPGRYCSRQCRDRDTQRRRGERRRAAKAGQVID